MSKGLKRSTDRGRKAGQAVVKHVIDLDAVPMFKAGSAAGIGFGSVVIGELPVGNIYLFGAALNVGFFPLDFPNGLSSAWDGDFSVGEAENTFTSLSGDEVNIVAKKSIGPAAFEAIAIGPYSTKGNKFIDNTAGDKAIWFNMLIDDADLNTDTFVDMYLQGDMTLVYSVFTA